MDTGAKLKQLREKKNLKQQDVADAVGISGSMISMYENDKKKPGRDTIIKLANFFGVDANFFMDDAVKKLTKKDERDIAKSLEKIMMDLEDKETGILAYGGKVNESDRELYSAAINGALEMIKLRNKDKYTPKKYKR